MITKQHQMLVRDSDAVLDIEDFPMPMPKSESKKGILGPLPDINAAKISVQSSEQRSVEFISSHNANRCDSARPVMPLISSLKSLEGLDVTDLRSIAFPMKEHLLSQENLDRPHGQVFASPAASFDEMVANVFAHHGGKSLSSFDEYTIYKHYGQYFDAPRIPPDSHDTTLLWHLHNDVQARRKSGSVNTAISSQASPPLTREIIEGKKFLPGGFTFFHSPHYLGPAAYRVYVNAKPDKITSAMQHLVATMDLDEHIKTVKTVSTEFSASFRKDPIVMYIGSKEAALEVAEKIRFSLTGLLRAEVPCLTEQISEGIAIAENPSPLQLNALRQRCKASGLEERVTNSFGSSRAKAIFLALYETRQKSSFKTTQDMDLFKKECLEIFKECHMSLE